MVLRAKDIDMAQAFKDYADDTEGMAVQLVKQDDQTVQCWMSAEYDPQVCAGVVKNFRSDWGMFVKD